MHTSPVQSTPVAQNETAVKAAPRQSRAAAASSVPQDKVSFSPQAQARIQQAVSADKDRDGDSK